MQAFLPSSEDLETSGNLRRHPLPAAGGPHRALQGGSPAAGQATCPAPRLFPCRLPAPQWPSPPTCCAEGEPGHDAVSPCVRAVAAAGTPWTPARTYPGRVLSLRPAPTGVPRHPAPAAPSPAPQRAGPSHLSASPGSPTEMPWAHTCPGSATFPAPRQHSSTRLAAGDCGTERAGGADSAAGAAIGSARPLPRPGLPAARRARERTLWQAWLLHCRERDGGRLSRSQHLGWQPSCCPEIPPTTIFVFVTSQSLWLRLWGFEGKDTTGGWKTSGRVGAVGGNDAILNGEGTPKSLDGN